jgi:hypothetical protein
LSAPCAAPVASKRSNKPQTRTNKQTNNRGLFRVGSASRGCVLHVVHAGVGSAQSVSCGTARPKRCARPRTHCMIWRHGRSRCSTPYDAAELSQAAQYPRYEY